MEDSWQQSDKYKALAELARLNAGNPESNVYSEILCCLIGMPAPDQGAKLPEVTEQNLIIKTKVSLKSIAKH